MVTEPNGIFHSGALLQAIARISKKASTFSTCSDLVNKEIPTALLPLRSQREVQSTVGRNISSFHFMIRLLRSAGAQPDDKGKCVIVFVSDEAWNPSYFIMKVLDPQLLDHTSSNKFVWLKLVEFASLSITTEYVSRRALGRTCN